MLEAVDQSGDDIRQSDVTPGIPDIETSHQTVGEDIYIREALDDILLEEYPYLVSHVEPEGDSVQVIDFKIQDS